MQELLTNRTIEKLKYDLVREGLISYEDLSGAEDTAKADSINLAQVLVKHRLISEEKLLSFIENKLHIPYVNLDDYMLDIDCLKYIPYEEALKYRIIPLFRIEDVLTVAMADPIDLFLLKNIINSVNCKVEPIICSERSIIQAIKNNYTSVETVEKVTEHVRFDWQDELNLETQDEFHIQKLLEAIICQGLLENSQEIFFEYTFNGLAVKFKTKDKIADRGYLPVLLVPSCITQIKQMAGLDSAISEVPQLGKLKFSLEEFKFNNGKIAKIVDRIAGSKATFTASVSTFPTLKGERISLKIYKPPVQLEKIDISVEKINTIKSVLEQNGIIIVAGKEFGVQTSFTYSLLSYLNELEKTILTIESIVKYDIQGINQCEINEKVGFSLETALKHIDFQSPDVIYFESLFSGESFEFAKSLASSGKLIIVGLAAGSQAEIEKYPINSIKNHTNCTIFIENNNIEII